MATADMASQGMDTPTPDISLRKYWGRLDLVPLFPWNLGMWVQGHVPPCQCQTNSTLILKRCYREYALPSPQGSLVSKLANFVSEAACNVLIQQGVTGSM
jgi:hypothetical protein